MPSLCGIALAVLAPNSATPFDLLTIGVSSAVVGACLMLADAAPRLLAPLATVGSMTLTLYGVHVLLLSAPVMWVLGSTAAFVVKMVILFGFGFALLWSRRFVRGPLEQLLASATHQARGLPNRPSRVGWPADWGEVQWSDPRGRRLG